MTKTASTWSSFDAAKKDGENLPPITIKGEEFIFPAAPSARFGFRVLELARDHKGQIPDSEGLALVLDLLGEDNATRLKDVATMPQLMGIFTDLMREYGFTDGAEGKADADPNP